MHISAAEAALAASAITGLASTLAGATVQRSARRSAHTAQLWERRVEAYEYVLTYVDWWRGLCDGQISAVRRGDREVIEAPDAEAEGDERRRLRSRLQMFGEPDVQWAYERSIQASLQLLSAVIAWRNIANLNAQAASGDIPPHEALSGEELVRLRHVAEATENAASDRYDELVDVIHEAVGRLPRYERRRVPRWSRRPSQA